MVGVGSRMRNEIGFAEQVVEFEVPCFWPRLSGTVLRVHCGLKGTSCWSLDMSECMMDIEDKIVSMMIDDPPTQIRARDSETNRTDSRSTGRFECGATAGYLPVHVSVP